MSLPTAVKIYNYTIMSNRKQYRLTSDELFRTTSEPVLRKTDENRSFLCFKSTISDQRDEKNVSVLIGFCYAKPTKSDDFVCLNSTKFSTREGLIFVVKSVGGIFGGDIQKYT